MKKKKIWRYAKISTILSFKIGKDAIQPFIVDSPQKIYETSEINVDTMFSMTSLVILL